MKYIYCFVIGILLYLLLNGNESFSVGCINIDHIDEGEEEELEDILEEEQKILIDSYKICNPSIYDDILSLMRCMIDNGELSDTYCSKEGECHRSRIGLFEVIDKYYNKNL